MTIILALIGGLLLLCVITLVILLLRTRPGFEDEDGFHEGVPDESAPARPELRVVEPDDERRTG